jgi:hypothetical protein
VRLIVAACAVALVAGAFAPRADACRCASPGPRALLQQADGAFVGRLVEKRERGWEAVYVFAIEQAVKGDFGTLVEVVAPTGGGSCAIGAQPRQRVGLFVRREGPILRSSWCWQVDPDDLVAAAKPLPRPTGRPPAVVLLGGQADGVQTMALDARGRILAYGPGRGWTLSLAVCPGGRLAVQMDSEKVRVLRLPRLTPVRDLPTGIDRSGFFPKALCCGDAEASRIHVFEQTNSGKPLGARFITLGTNRREVWAGRADAVSFDPDGTRAYINAGENGTSLITLNLDGGRVEPTATLPPYTGPLVPSLDGRSLAGIANPRRYVYPGAGPTSIVLVRPSGAVSVVPVSRRVSGEAAWWGPRVVFLPTYVESEGVDRIAVYDPRRRTLRRPLRWPVGAGTVRGNTAYGVRSGRVYAADLRTARLRVIQRVPTTLTASFTVVPGGR